MHAVLLFNGYKQLGKNGEEGTDLIGPVKVVGPFATVPEATKFMYGEMAAHWTETVLLRIEPAPVYAEVGCEGEPSNG